MAANQTVTTPQSQMMVKDGCGLCGYIPCQCNKPQTTKYDGYKFIDLSVAIIAVISAALAWVPDLVSVGNLRLGYFLFWVYNFAIAARCISNGGSLWKKQ